MSRDLCIHDEEAKKGTNKSMVCDKSRSSALIISYFGQNKDNGKKFHTRSSLIKMEMGWKK